MAAALMSKLFLHRPGRLCFTPICRLATISSHFICIVSKKQKPTALLSDTNLRESDQKHNRDRRRYLPISWLVLGALYLSSNSSTANCIGEDGDFKSGSCPSEGEHKQSVSTTPVNSGSLRDISGCFTSSRKKNCATKKATQLRNSRVDKAKRKLVLDSEDENPQELKKVTRSSLVSLLFRCKCNILLSTCTVT